MSSAPFPTLDGTHPTSARRFQDRVVLRRLTVQEPWSAVVIVQPFPMAVETRSKYRDIRRLLLQCFPEIATLSCEAFFQADRIDFERDAPQLQRYGQWLGSSGLGIYPQNEPPRVWTQAELEDLFPPEKPRSLFFDIVRIAPKPEALKALSDLLLGSGSYVEAYCPEKDSFYQNATKAFLPSITDPNMRAFRYHAPLMQGSALTGTDKLTLDAWTCGAHVYVRESIEDNGLLVLRRGPLDVPLLELEKRAAAHDIELVLD